MLASAGRSAKVRTKNAQWVSHIAIDWLLDLAKYVTRSPFERVAFAGAARMYWSMARVTAPLGTAR